MKNPLICILKIFETLNFESVSVVAYLTLYIILFLECVSILAAYLGPSKAVPLMRAIELLESHFEKVNYLLLSICYSIGKI